MTWNNIRTIYHRKFSRLEVSACAGATFSVQKALETTFFNGHGEQKDRLGKISNAGALEKWYSGHSRTGSVDEWEGYIDPPKYVNSIKMNFCKDFIFKDFILFFFQREDKGGRKRGRESSMCEINIDRLSPARTPTRDPTHNPRGIKLATFCFAG